MLHEIVSLSTLLPLAGVLWLVAPWLLVLLGVCYARQPLAQQVAAGLCLTVLAGSVFGFILTQISPVATSQIGGQWWAVQVDMLSSLMMALTALIGWVIIRYSDRYLAGNPHQASYFKDLFWILASVWLLVSTHSVLVLVLAWLVNDLLLHRLLTFFSQRPAAILAARKRLLAVSLANLCLIAATLWLYALYGTFAIDALLLAVSHNISLPSLWGVALLLVMGVMLKTAQLPAHGWILQVMEAPTPVSALLHAGIINIGGYVLLRFSGLLDAVPTAQVLLVVIGGLTACVASVVMLTRVSIKVMLAWSTCAQMGFMLLEIGLGAYSLALLHLLAHSLYKAHAFLAAGETAWSATRLNQLAAPAMDNSRAKWLRLLLVMGLAAGIGFIGFSLTEDAVFTLFVFAYMIGIFPLLQAYGTAGQLRSVLTIGATLLGLMLLYALLHQLFEQLLPSAVDSRPAFLFWAVALAFGVLLLVQEMVIADPAGRFARWLHPRAFAGFYLDEGMTRLTWRLWPSRIKSIPANSTNLAILTAKTAQEQP